MTEKKKEQGLPEEFLRVTEKVLGEEFPAFLEVLDPQASPGQEGGPGPARQRKNALRVNEMKIDAESFAEKAPFALSPVPWVRNGFYYNKEQCNPSGHPWYRAGLYYLQEASAMTPASRLKVEPGDRVLDLCAAPGGKATALGAALKGQGLLVANDINTARARALLRNLELFGIPNLFVVSEAPYVLASRFPEYFDKVMVDAPCSGEGMFRKNPEVIEAWKEKGPDYFSGLQREIILHGADMLRPGGLMLYSTCTFSPLENEAVVSHLLRERPQMELLPMEDYEGFSEGLTAFDGLDLHPDCRMCRRIWPHRMAGEGHFLALLKKKGGKAEATGVEQKEKKKRRAPGKTKNWWDNFSSIDMDQKESLRTFFADVAMDIDPGRIDLRGGRIYYIPDRAFIGAGLHFLRNGLMVGELKKKRFEPAQSLALALSESSYKRTVSLSADDERLTAYLRGETIRVEADAYSLPPEKKGGNSWYLLLADGYPLGFCKASGNLLKNKYPAGWRK